MKYFIKFYDRIIQKIYKFRKNINKRKLKILKIYFQMSLKQLYE